MRRLQSYSALPANPRESTLSALAKKLRLKPEHEVAVLNPPPGYLAFLAPGPATIVTELKPGRSYDAVQLFVNNPEELNLFGAAAARAVKPDGLLWIAHPRGAWTRKAPLVEIPGESGYAPTSLVKIDETWTAIRFKKP